MPSAFNFSASPFDCLSSDEQRLVRNSLDVAYFREGQTILEPGEVPTHLFVIIKGYVSQQDGGEEVATYGPDDCFDGRSLIAGKVSSKFVANEEVLVYQLAHQAVSDLIGSNATFGALLFSDLSKKLSALSERNSERELQSLTTSRVDQAYVRKAQWVDAEIDIVSVARILQSQRLSSVMVRDKKSEPPRSGLFSTTDLQRAILDGGDLNKLQVGSFANYNLIEVNASDQLGDAMAIMLRLRVHRVVVVDGGEIIGILAALDLFSYLSNQSHMISERIEEAEDLDGLAKAASQITQMMASLYRSGTRVNLIAKLVQQLNARLFERAWQLIAPAELVANSCLFVMGSEGRGEQLLKTDQDNGLILRDGFQAPENLGEICQNFSKTLADFGYPECPGGIMISNEQWRNTTSGFSQMVRQWLIQPDADGLMKLAMFMDAHAVCGDFSQLAAVRDSLMDFAMDNDAVLARFASAIDQFAHSNGWWNRLLGKGDAPGQINLKKEGIFPLVHGVRSLALASRITETTTVGRITALVAEEKISQSMGDDLVQSLYFFMGLKLKAGLAELDADKVVTGAVDTTRLSTLDRDLLKDTLGVVKQFRQQLRMKFRLDAM